MTIQTALQNTEQLTHPKYRLDIDGLRAIAVLSVVIYHAFPKFVRGGFIGVDIFFVISGFLISTIIMGSLERNSFSFIEFYSRRIRRIFPALLLVLTASFVLGWFVLLADEYKQLGKHIAGGAGFISNFLYWSESGYFDDASETKPLLHLWSLGIEEQFYIVWPLLLWLAWKKRFNLLTITIVVAVISFALNLSKVHGNSDAAFYSPQTRFWEMLVGSILAYMTLHKRSLFPKFKRKLDMWRGQIFYVQAPENNGKTLRNIQSLIGAVLILTGLLVITKERHFPGWWAILPIMGTMLIISAGVDSWFNRVVLTNRVLVWFGLISFPLYLWHWPLLSFAKIIEGDSLSSETRITAVMISIALAWFTYKFFEMPFRFGNHSRAKTIILFLLMFTCGLVGYVFYKQDGLSFRAYPSIFKTYTQSIIRTERVSECFDIPFAYEKKGNWFCNLGNKSIQPSFFAYGDSHALSLLPVLEKYSTENKLNILFAGTSGCPPLLEIQAMRGEEQIRKYNCQKLNDRVFNFVKKNKINSVLLIARRTYYTGGTTKPDELVHISMDVNKEATLKFSRASFEYGLEQTIEKYKSIGVRVYLFSDIPQQIYAVKDTLRKSRLTDSSINHMSVSTKEHKNNQSWVSSHFLKIPNELAAVVNFDNALCNNNICPIVSNGKSLYIDDDHLSINGSMLLYPDLMQVLTNSK